MARQSVSKWFKGETAADPDIAIHVADVLGAPRAGAMRAIGLPVVARALEEAAGGSGPTGDVVVDPNVEWIRSLTDRSPARKARMIKRYQDRVALIRQDLELAEAEARDTDDGG